MKEQLLSMKDNWKYKDAASATTVKYGDDVKNWTKWDGESEIETITGHHITLVECDQNYKAVSLRRCNSSCEELRRRNLCTG